MLNCVKNHGCKSWVNSLHHVWCPVPNIWSNSLKMIHLVTALDKVLCYARRLQSTWPKNIFGRIKLLYPKHLELHFEMQKSKAVTDSPSWDLKKCLFSVGQWLVSATVEGCGADPSAITWLLDLSWWFPQRLECACACTKLPMPGKLSSYTGSRVLTFQLGSGGRENPPPLLGWHSFKITSTGTIYPKLKEHDSKIISSWLIHFVSLTEVFDNIIWFCSRWTGNTTTKYSSQKWNFLFSQKLEILRLWDTRFWTSLSTSSPMFWYSARTIVSAAPPWAHVLHTPFLDIYV